MAHRLGSWFGCVIWLAVACSDGSDGNGSGSATDAGAGGMDAGADPGGEGGEGSDAASTTTPDAAEDEAGRSPGESIDVDAFCDGIFDAACDWLDRCRSGFPGECQSWWGTQNALAICGSLRADLEAGRVTFDGEQAAACLAASTDESDCSFPEFVENRAQPGEPPPAVCADVITGQVPTDGDCFGEGNVLSDGCAAGNYCKRDACPGSCVGYAAIGDDCDPGTDVRCDPTEAYCLEGTCTAREGSGGTCTSGGQCQLGLLCLYDSEAEGECLARVGEGEDCSVKYRNCEAGLACAGGTCKATVARGERCAGDDNCPDGDRCTFIDGNVFEYQAIPGVGDECADGFCPEGQDCLDVSGDGTALCAAQGGPGDSCDGIRCLDGNYCDYSAAPVCVAFHAEDESCLAAGIDPGERRCQDGLVCVITGQNVDGAAIAAACKPPPAAQGDPCVPSFEDHCPEGLYCQRPGYTCQPPEADAASCSAAVPARSCGSDSFCGCDGDSCGGFSSSRPPEPNELCTARKANGETCANGFECQSDWCQGDTCADRPPPNAPPTGLCWSEDDAE